MLFCYKPKINFILTRFKNGTLYDKMILKIIFGVESIDMSILVLENILFDRLVTCSFLRTVIYILIITLVLVMSGLPYRCVHFVLRMSLFRIQQVRIHYPKLYWSPSHHMKIFKGGFKYGGIIRYT